MSRSDRMAMIDRDAVGLSVRRQCALLGLARSGVYRVAPAPDPEDLALMRRIDALYLELPFYGSRRMTLALKAEGRAVNRKRVQRLMRLMGLEAMVPQPRTSRPAPEHRVYPYLLRGVAIERANQVWAADITYIPMARGFLYLVAVIDWSSRSVLAWRLSNTLDGAFCVEALEEALARMAGRRSSTPTRGRSSRPPPSPAGWQRPASRSAWTAGAAGSTTCSSSGCGGR